MQCRPAATPDLFFPVSQTRQEVSDPFLNRHPGPQAQVAGGLLSRPAPYCLIGIEVRAVARQVHQPQVQVRRPQVFPQGITTMGRRIVPDHVQPPAVLPLQLLQEGNRGPGVAVPLHFHPFHLTGLQAHRRISSWPSRHAAGWSNPPRLALPSTSTCPAVQHPSGSGPRQRRISLRRCALLPPAGRHTPPRRLLAWPHPP